MTRKERHREPGAALLVACLLVAACSKKAPDPGAGPAGSAVSASGGTAAQRPGIPVPGGPVLAILPGEGVGPIRLGATVATIERLMDAPCDVKTVETCSYVNRAVEFRLKDGAATEIRIHRVDRASDLPGRTYGVFNGRFAQGAMLGMFREAVAEVLGSPSKTTPVSAGGKHGTVELHEYEGARLEYDRIANGNVVLGGVIVSK